MPVQTRSAARRAAEPETPKTPDEIWSEFDREAAAIDSKEPVEGPLAEDEEWAVAYVKFKTQLLKRPLDLNTRYIATFRWWLRFRTKKHWWKSIETEKPAYDRVKEIVRAQCSPPLEYQKKCDYCHAIDPKTGHYYLPYYIHDEDFIDIEFMPYDMETSDDDEHARIMVPKTIAVVEKLKAYQGSCPPKTPKELEDEMLKNMLERKRQEWRTHERERLEKEIRLVRERIAAADHGTKHPDHGRVEWEQPDATPASRRMTRSQAAKLRARTGYQVV